MTRPSPREIELAEQWKRANMLADYREELLKPFITLADEFEREFKGAGQPIRRIVERARRGEL